MMASADCFLLFPLIKQLGLVESCLFEDFVVRILEGITSALLQTESVSGFFVDPSGLDALVCRKVIHFLFGKTRVNL